MFNQMFKKNRQEAKKIEILSKDREETRVRIRKLNVQMKSVVDNAAKADELDRRILSADYSSLKDQLQAEMQHFKDLSRLIGQMKNADLTRQCAAALEKIVVVSNQMDLDELIAGEDYMAVCRQMLAEEDERYRDAAEAKKDQDDFFGEDEEFSRLVAAAKIRNCLIGTEMEQNTDPVQADSLI